VIYEITKSAKLDKNPNYVIYKPKPYFESKNKIHSP